MLILFVFLTPYFLKIILIGDAFYMDDEHSYVSIAINDAQIIGACYISYKAAELSKIYSFYILRIFSLLLYVFYIIDMALIILFSTRLYLIDVLSMYDDIFIFLNLFSFNVLILTIFSILCTTLFITNKNPPNKHSSHIASLLIVLIPLFYVGFTYEQNTSVRSVFFRNYVDINFNSTYFNEYTDKFISTFTYSPKNSCSQIESRPPDSIYIFLVESWSNYHSKLYGNQNNWTPHLDNLAKNNISLTRFYANGFTTEAGLYSLLTGRLPILYGQMMKLDGGVGLMHFPKTNTLPDEMAKLGYYPYFITSGDLNFLDKGEWLKKSGFSSIIGADDYSDSSKRYLFNSVSDGELFDKVEHIIASDSRPKFIVIENVSTHAPFYSPGINGEAIQSEKKAFLYTDKLISNLISKITTENNLVIVMSDHRAMTTITEREKELSGEMSVSRVPAFIMWHQKKWQLDKEIQQTDLMSSIVGLIQGRQCAGDTKGSLFPIEQAISPKCIFHARGDNRELITVKCEENSQEFNIVLDGDNTRAKMETAESKLAVDIVNYTRIQQH